MSDFEIEAELLKIKYRYNCRVNIDLFFPTCGLSQYKRYSTQKHKNVLLLSGITFFHRKSFRTKDG
jgi:hypothetical protein